MIDSLEKRPLTAGERKYRLLTLVILPAALLALAFTPANGLPHWLPFVTSCGAFTGLPCIFCGTTRALHHLLHGDLGSALYYNWLTIPILSAACCLLVTHTLELVLNRNFLALLPRPHLTRRRLSALAAALVLLWCLQVYLAVTQRKTELLNPSGILYSLVVR